MDKIARYSPKWKASADPNQEKLRSAKANWNKEVSHFIDDLINFKWLINGKPNIFNSSKSPLTKPIQADPETIAGVLDSDFSQIVSGANRIISLQEEYSRTRKKKVEKQAAKLSLASDYKDLIELKSKWNKKINSFKKDLINFLWLINGKPSKFNMQRSDIKEPIPSDPSTIIGVLDSDFKEIISDVKKIISMQNSIFEEKKKKAYDYNFSLYSEASNPFSRFFSKVKNISLSGDEEALIKKVRSSLLGHASDLNRAFLKVRRNVLSSSKSEDFDKVKSLTTDLQNKFSIFSKDIESITSKLDPEILKREKQRQREQAEEERKRNRSAEEIEKEKEREDEKKRREDEKKRKLELEERKIAIEEEKLKRKRDEQPSKKEKSSDKIDEDVEKLKRREERDNKRLELMRKEHEEFLLKQKLKELRKQEPSTSKINQTSTENSSGSTVTDNTPKQSPTETTATNEFAPASSVTEVTPSPSVNEVTPATSNVPDYTNEYDICDKEYKDYKSKVTPEILNSKEYKELSDLSFKIFAKKAIARAKKTEFKDSDFNNLLLSFIEKWKLFKSNFIKESGERKVQLVALAFMDKLISDVRENLEYLNPFDSNSYIKIRISRTCEDLRKILNEVMDSLEEDLDLNFLNDSKTKMSEIISELSKDLSTVSSTSFKLKDEDSEKLQKMMNQKKLRDIANFSFKGK